MVDPKHFARPVIVVSRSHVEEPVYTVDDIGTVFSIRALRLTLDDRTYNVVSQSGKGSGKSVPFFDVVPPETYQLGCG